MPPDENDGPEPRFPDPGRNETRWEPLPPSSRYARRRRVPGCLLAIAFIVLLVLLAFILIFLGIIDIPSR